MSKKKYPVIAEMIDARDGKRYFPGQAFETEDAKQAKRLTDAGCLGEPGEALTFDYERDKLGELDLTNAQPGALLAIAKHEGAELKKGDKTTPADLVKAIVARRAIVSPDYDRDKLGELELTQANRAQLDVIVAREGVEGIVAETSDADVIKAIEAKRKPQE
ncbi:hypothetical protein [Sphingomonas sp. MS122]|uniref:hypothetical protein n=1 Tax=Sphingomonas sp. MS122 TaxID=3412683 RepID=UPI003C303EB2